MREFTPKEKELLRDFVRHRKNEDIPNLEVAKFIKSELETFAVKWQSKPNKIIQFFSVEENKENPEKANSNYFRICDFVYFLIELEKYGFIKFQRPISLEDKDDDTILLYDKDKYEYIPKNNLFLEIHKKNVTLPFGNDNWTMKSLVEIKSLSNFYLDFLYDLVRVGNSIIYPLPRLIDYVEHDFKTLEQHNFEEQLDEAKKSTCWSRTAAIIAFVTLIFTLCQTCCDKQNDSEQINSIITAIKEHKTMSIDSIKTLPADTFNVNIIQQEVKPAPKPQQNPLEQPIPKN